MITLTFEKIYLKERLGEPCSIAVPIAKDKLRNIEGIVVAKDGIETLSQTKVTSYWEDGSIRFLFVRFLANLPGNQGTSYELYLDRTEFEESKNGNKIENSVLTYEKKPNVLCLTKDKDSLNYTIDTGELTFTTKTGQGSFLKELKCGGTVYEESQFGMPQLYIEHEGACDFKLHEFHVVEEGPVCVTLEGEGEHIWKEKSYRVTVQLTAYAGKPWFEVSYRLFNTSNDALPIESLQYEIFANGKEKNKLEVNRTCVATSNYRTSYLVSEEGETVSKKVDAEDLLYEANEHIAEVFYGTMFADYNTSEGGVCATIYQAQQNYPKAVEASKQGIKLSLVPENATKVIMQSGMAREQKFLLHFHSNEEDLKELNNRSLIYQMPDRPQLDSNVYRESGTFHDVFVDKKISKVELSLIAKADSHARCYGMLNWGDSPDPGYTTQGRGGGLPVWTNNEYDFPHACALMYVRTGTRRFLDYLLVAGRHWMDVDVCHYSDNPLYYGGQWEHTNNHVLNSTIVCSHQWVEGLIDYYHFTGDEEAYKTAIGIGENILRLLETPMFHKKGEINARETGWAMRSLVALYKETHEERWLLKCDWIVGHFEDWEKEYGHWLSPYTDNTAIRVVFMISIAVGSLMRYYRIRPSENIKGMIIRAVDDLIENCYMDNGLFYYKELPSLKRLGNNTIILEALTICYELTGNEKYLTYGLMTFESATDNQSATLGGSKKIVGDSVIGPGPGTKNFAQSFLPLVSYYKAATDTGILF
ncbi:glycoside hydrolase family protein [Lachnoclostridium phytofermentans]|uniref:Uncharacterized protein n=1 Tax=Lachnoclostridium phytofermentans (strain ATCC 700394 / DSM 18823 / ISDg) TaxID=357809 RepID=A9KNX1_LACP7|nr:hypothetical protein [Lachnoclostridium phytofermentans]ABX43141.1 hypothetical protein Cphy_2781 [Lachnoclostridium phytofermentans ISDg]